MENITIPTFTVLTSSISSISIFTYYTQDQLPYTILATIQNSAGSKNSTDFIENELTIDMIHFPDSIDYIIDEQGNLILIDGAGDESKYSIDNNGNLIWTI